MQFNILGPLEATESSAPVPLAGGKQRALLALLLLNAGRVVGVERIVDDLWGEDVPETAPKMVQIFVSQLRKQLPEGLLRTRAPGYAIELGEHGLDLRRFEELHAGGRAALAEGRHEDAAALLREALALWRGPALPEFDEPFARVESARLEEARLACLEERAGADLALGRHAELVAELDALVRRHPRRERLRAHHLLALYRSGRQAEALDGYRAYRTMLDEELGLEPSAAMRELERKMLRQDPGLEAAPREPAARATVPAPAEAPRAPAERPPGRERELGFLQRLLAEARGGERRVAFVTGETGIGKTTVVEAFLDDAARAPETLVARGQCVEHRGAGEPYLPVLEALGRLCRGPAGAELVPLLSQQAPTWVAQMPWLLADEELDAVQRRLVGANHERMLREMLEALEAVSARATVVLVLEDLHWSDPSTVDLLDALARRRESARLLVVGTYRRGDAGARRHPADRLAQALRGRGLSTEIAVGPLGGDDVACVMASRLGTVPPEDVVRLLYERTAGNPLFVTSLLDSWLAEGLLADDGSPADPARLAEDVPETVRQVIEQTLLQLDPDDHELLAAASVIGREFAVAAAAAAVERTEDDADARCDALARTGRFLVAAGEELWPDGTLTVRYRFGHDLHRAVLYERLPPGRRARLHARVGERLEAAYGERKREIGAQLAEHFVRAGDARRAVASLRLAAEQALERLAPREALEHLAEALRLVERLPEDEERKADEFVLHSMLGATEVAAQGWAAPEAEAAFLRAHELAEQLGRGDDSGRTLLQLGGLYEVRGEYERAAEVLERALAACGPEAGSGLVTDSHEVLACSFFHQGVFDDALRHAERGLAAYDGVHVNPAAAAVGDHSGTGLHTWAALSLWFLGYPDQAWERVRAAVELTGSNPHLHGHATALAHAAIIGQCRRDPDAARVDAEGAIEVAGRGGYRYRLGMATVLRGWARASQGEHEEGIAELERGIELSQSTGGHMDDPYYFALLADACLHAGRHDEARVAVETALEHTPRGGRAFFYKAELYRLQGELELAAGRRSGGEERLRSSLELAHSQSARSLELRAALSLARLLDAEGDGESARELVATVYETFTEGFDTRDLVEARALLERLPAAAR